MIGSFPIHVPGLIVIIAGIIFFLISTVICSFCFLTIEESSKTKEWTKAFLISALLMLVLHILFSFPLTLFFAVLYEKLSKAYGFDFEKTKDFYDKVLLIIWMILMIAVWIFTAKSWHDKKTSQLQK